MALAQNLFTIFEKIIKCCYYDDYDRYDTNFKIYLSKDGKDIDSTESFGYYFARHIDKSQKTLTEEEIEDIIDIAVDEFIEDVYCMVNE